MRKRHVVAALLFLVATISFSKDVTLKPGKPADVGMDKVVLDAGVNMFRVAVEQDKVRSVVLLVVRNGKIVLHEAIGWKDKQKRHPH